LPLLKKTTKTTAHRKSAGAKSPRKLRSQAAGRNKTRPAAGAKSAAKKSAPKKRRVARKATSRKRTTPADALFQPGLYTTPQGNVSVGVPAFWTLRQTNDDLEIESPSAATSVIVTAFQRDGNTAAFDARQYLERFLRTAPVKGRANIETAGRSRAMSQFRDLEGDQWQVEFLSDGDTLLLATMNSTLPVRSQELQTGAQILRSLRLQER
jgi:hypothetical protein